MKVTPIVKPQKDERVVGVHPTMAPQVEADWRRRLNYYVGRSLSDVALATEQTQRAGRLALRGQLVSAGVVEGLELGLEDTGPETPAFYHLTPGFGIAASGEDVRIATPLRIDVRRAPVYAPVTLLEPPAEGDEEAVVGGSLLPRRLGPAFGDAVDQGLALPRVGILLLQPITLQTAERFDADDPCEEDVQSLAFEDWQLVDGCRLVWYAWPEEWQPLPLPGDAWRNRLAYTIFTAEQGLEAGTLLPWEAVGVPVALVALDETMRPLFVDRYAVVRSGGKPKRRTALTPARGNPFLWQARLQQFNAQMAEAIAAGQTPAELTSLFNFMSPAGLLPKSAVTFAAQQEHFFPSRFDVDAVPVPLEQLDAALEASASLAPFDLSGSERLRVLVPVNQSLYEPDLLVTAAVDPEFEATFNEFSTRRNRWLRRRLEVRSCAAVLFQALKGVPLTFPDPEPDVVGEETPAEEVVVEGDPEFGQPEEEFGTALLEGGQTRLRTVPAINELRTFLRQNTPLRKETRVNIPLGAAILIPDQLRNKVSQPPNVAQLIVQGILTTEERDALLEAGENSAFKEAILALFDLSQEDEIAPLDTLGLERYIDFLGDKVKRANDTVDFGFVRAQTDIYRLRRLMLGNLDASRLATSPTLAAIAQEETALATQEGIRAFLEKVKAATPQQSPSALADLAAAPRFPSDTLFQRGGSKFVGGTRFTSPELIQPPPKGTTPAVGSGVLERALERERIAATPTVERAGGATVSRDLLDAISGRAEVDLPKVSEVLKADVSATDRGKFFDFNRDVKDAIVQQPAIVGNAQDFRTVTVAERLKMPEANEAKAQTVVTQYEVVKGLGDIGIVVDDIQVRPAKFNPQGQPIEPAKTIGDYRNEGFHTILDDPDPPDADEAKFFAVAVDKLDYTVATLRRIEGRIQAYNMAIAECRKTLATVMEFAVQADRRLKVIADKLAEARHDVAVARALWDEETARIDAINERRRKILDEGVTFLAFYRPRTTDLRLDLPTRPLDPGLREAPAPACRRRPATIPPELRVIVNLLRSVPLKWFKRGPEILHKFERPENLQLLLKTAALRSQVQMAAEFPIFASPAASQSLLGASVQKVITAQQATISQQTLVKSTLSLTALAATSWHESFVQARDRLSLGDLIAPDHGHSEVTTLATARLDEIAHVAGCLYAGLGRVPAAIRLDWAERLSQFDAPTDLHSLASLPRWGEIEDRLLRADLQALVDWLYDSVDALQTQAVEIMSDIVRVCILLASHAPVNQIIAGRVQQEAPAQPGSRVKVVVKPERIRIGMPAFIFDKANQIIAEAIVDDLSGAQAVTKIVRILGVATKIDLDDQVHFGDAHALQTNAVTGSQSLMAQVVTTKA